MSVNHPTGPASAVNDPGIDSGTSPAGEWKALRGDVEGIADVAVERGRGFVSAARAQATDYVDRRKLDAAQSVNDLAQGLRDSSKSFDDKPNIKAFFDSAAEGLEQLGSSIEKRSFAEFYDDAEAFARRAPVAVAVATFVTGFVVSRFVKSSSVAQDRDPRDAYGR